MSKTKKIISLVLVAMLVMAMATVAIVSTSALAEGETYIVAGSETLCGSNWDTADTNNQMTWNADKGVYEKVYTNVAAGTYNYKVVRGTSWGDAYTEYGPANSMGDDGVITVADDGSTVTLVFNGSNVEINVEAGAAEPTTVTEPTQATTVTEPTQATTVTEPTQATTATEPTQATTVVEPVEGNGVTVGGKTYEVAVGDEITYTYTLTTPTAVENAQATTYFDAAKLELVAGTAREMFPVLRDITSVVYNTDIAGEVKFNATEGVDEGFDFTAGGVLVTLKFKVLDASASEIYTTLEEMVKFGEKVDYATGGAIVADGVTYTETLEGGTVVTTSTETEPTGTTVGGDDPADKGITVGGVVYPVTIGDVVTYTFELTTPTNIENAQATTYFDATKLELVDATAREMFPVLRDVTSVVYNTDIPGEVKFNATEGVDEGFDFTEGGILVTLKFKVLDDSASEIKTIIEEMVKFGEKVDYATGGQIVADGVTYVETLTGNTVPPVSSSTEPTQTTVTEPTEVTTVTEPTEVTTVTEPTEPTATETKPVEPTATETEPTEATTATAAAPGTDPTSITEAGTTAPNPDAPETGAAAYIYVVVAVLAMAACAVVVLRKRVNG